MSDSLYISVDLGAGSGRVFLVGFGSDSLLLNEVHRFHYPPAKEDGHLRWPFPAILKEIELGLRLAGQRAQALGCQVTSVAVDSWAVDYGLIDREGHLIENPICYRDERTQGAMEPVFNHIPPARLFGLTGIQFLPFNTIFQLCAHAQADFADSAKHLLLIPDLVNHELSGRTVTEYTNATTTQMVNAATGNWDQEIIEALGLPSRLLPEIVPSGTNLGQIRKELAKELELEKVSVIAGATHDTAAAVAGTPLQKNWAYISSGTWSLVGVELDRPLINDEVARHNFTNEGGIFGTIRFLKNVTGTWILDSCVKEWTAQGLNLTYEKLLWEAGSRRHENAVIFPDDPRFFNPPSMFSAIAEQLAETGQQIPAEPSATTSIILDSLALRYASVLGVIQSLTAQKLEGLHIVGGGSQNHYLNQASATATGLPVLAGPAEATVLGNAIVQGIASGRFRSLAEARTQVAKHLSLKKYEPQPSSDWEDRLLRYRRIEASFTARGDRIC